jgi:hypothetical protein
LHDAMQTRSRVARLLEQLPYRADGGSGVLSPRAAALRRAFEEMFYEGVPASRLTALAQTIVEAGPSATSAVRDLALPLGSKNSARLLNQRFGVTATDAKFYRIEVPVTTIDGNHANVHMPIVLPHEMVAEDWRTQRHIYMAHTLPDGPEARPCAGDRGDCRWVVGSERVGRQTNFTTPKSPQGPS